ncbi:Hypothetical_protein [Hexamita inflata]|uniref:Hypothetical_protein n=1 Tax=Hexamita inflata TaxID=28002 RepID=A0ABP1GI31_9EUKA
MIHSHHHGGHISFGGSHYHGGGYYGRRQTSPMEIFTVPICYRIAAWIWPILLVTCISLIIVQESGAGSTDGGLFIGAAFAGFFCFFTVIYIFQPQHVVLWDPLSTFSFHVVLVNKKLI